MNNTAEKISLNEVNKDSLTPMMRQYMEVKERHKDHLLFYRMGDFYELFFEDATAAAPVLDIALTKRGKLESMDIPMCGVPFHSSEYYLEKLIKAGFKVAICDQLETPEEAKKRGYKAVVKRDVTRIITAGTITEETLLDGKSSNFLCSISLAGDNISIAWVDISTGDLYISETTKNLVYQEISRISPKEILVSEKLVSEKFFESISYEYRKILTIHSDSFFTPAKNERIVKKHYNIISLDALGVKNASEISALGSLLEYVELTQKGNIPTLSTPKRYLQSNFLQIDAATRTNLELFYSTNGEYKGSLLSVIDKTKTNSGARLLKNWLASPLTEINSINARHDAVAFFNNNSSLKEKISTSLKQVSDIERALIKIEIMRAGPRDLLVIREGLKQSQVISELLELSSLELPTLVNNRKRNLSDHTEIIHLLDQALEDQVGIYKEDGGYIKPGYNPTLDGYREIRENSEKIKETLKEKYRAETEITNLKIGDNNLIGMFIEVTSQHLKKVPDSFIHRQTMSGAIRYTTPELRELENKMVTAKGSSLKLELDIFLELSETIIKAAKQIIKTAEAMATLDVITSFSELSSENNYTRPSITSEKEFNIEQGRHPVVEYHLKKSAKKVVSNDCSLLPQSYLWLLTGPNMAGKSTFLRQNALIIILAQIGSFVPAKTATIGLFDKIFSRVGASDDIARGRSTFMVEMIETASILNQATDKSFIIMDEIGRGTATYDGMSIAWAVLEYLHNNIKARALFATHYHELNSLIETLNHLSAHRMRIKEWNEQIVFLYEVEKGAGDKSYGIHVAKIAGVPKQVTSRAETILTEIIESSKTQTRNFELPLFSQSSSPQEKSKIETMLETCNPDELTPKQALEFLYQLKKTDA